MAVEDTSLDPSEPPYLGGGGRHGVLAGHLRRVCGFFEHCGYRMTVDLSLPQLALVVAAVYIRATSEAAAVHHQESVALGQRPLGPTTTTAMHGRGSEDLPRWSIAYENRCGHCTCTRP